MRTKLTFAFYIVVCATSALAQTSTQNPSSPAPLIQPQTTTSTAPVSVPATGATAEAGVVNKKMNLEDIAVKGELLGDDRMSFVRRQREELKNRIKFRTNFRTEILQEYKQ